ncbi:MAG: (d)CMP kinase, partial [Clostridia bacterium]|nr:(d)CMP kinase [Clostridia bacterium]
MVIAMDGPTASGKGTISKLLAKKLNYLCLDTGAIYRAIAVCDLRGKDFRNSKIEIRCGDDKKTLVFLDGQDITNEIRSITVSNHVPVVAKNPVVQDCVHEIQHQTASNLDVVVEGRETTSVAFPHADYKFYITATLEERARRRYFDYVRRDEKITPEEVLLATRERDRMDMERDESPLIQVPDAIVIDTTGRMADEVVDEMLSII